MGINAHGQFIIFIPLFYEGTNIWDEVNVIWQSEKNIGTVILTNNFPPSKPIAIYVDGNVEQLKDHVGLLYNLNLYHALYRKRADGTTESIIIFKLRMHSWLRTEFTNLNLTGNEWKSILIYKTKNKRTKIQAPDKHNLTLISIFSDKHNHHCLQVDFLINASPYTSWRKMTAWPS